MELLWPLLFLLLLTSAQPLWRRFFQPSSPMFSVIAHHKGAVFQYHLLKTDGHDLLLNADETAAFGRIRATQGYILNLPGTNSLQPVPENKNVHVDPETYKLSVVDNLVNATQGFGIEHQKLTFRNSSGFLACPDDGYRGEYHLYWGNYNFTSCPNNAQGYDVELLVQVDATVNYNPQTNHKRFHFF